MCLLGSGCRINRRGIKLLRIPLTASLMLLMLVGAAVADEALRERLKKAWDDSEKQFQEDMSGDLGHGAIALCRHDWVSKSQ